LYEGSLVYEGSLAVTPRFVEHCRGQTCSRLLPGDDGLLMATAPPIPVISRAELLRPSSVIGPHLAKEGWEMSDTYIIEVASQAAGIVVRDADGYRFFAATHRFNPLEGRLFRNAREAERAASRLMTGGVTLAA
jgi:hypothetical protein